VHIAREDTYVLTIQSNPVGNCQSIDKDRKESLVVCICHAHEVRIVLDAHMHGPVPAHVAGHNLVAAAPVFNIVRERVVIGVCGGFGYICFQKK